LASEDGSLRCIDPNPAPATGDAYLSVTGPNTSVFSLGESGVNFSSEDGSLKCIDSDPASTTGDTHPAVAW